MAYLHAVLRTSLLTGLLSGLLVLLGAACLPQSLAAQACNSDADCSDASCSPQGRCVSASEAGGSLGAPVTHGAPQPAPTAQPVIAPRPVETVPIIEQSELPPPPPAPTMQPAMVPPPPVGQYPGYSGVPQPTGYETVSRPRKGLIIAGSITFGVPWILTASTSYLVAEASGDEEILLGIVPIAGPLFLLGQTNDPVGEVIVGFSLLALAQAAGITMFIIGFAAPSEEQVPIYQTLIMPTTMGQDGGGIVALGNF